MIVTLGSVIYDGLADAMETFYAVEAFYAAEASYALQSPGGDRLV
jgi:hypothetical protein